MASAAPQPGPKSRSRLLPLIGALALVGIIYLCLPRSWFEIPDERPTTNDQRPTTNDQPAPAPAPPDLTTVRAAVEKTPLDFEARSRYGMALSAAGHHEDAEKEFLAAARLAPEFPGVYHNLGIFYNNQNQPKRADTAFQRELELAPGNGRAHHFRGLALQAQKRYKEAQRQFRLAVALEPDFPDAYLSLAILLSRDAPEEEVRKLIEDYIRLTGNKGLAYYVLSGAYRTRKDYATAARYAEISLEAEPANYAYLHNLGQIYSYGKRYPEADTTLRKALQALPSNINPHTVYIELGMNSQNAGKFSDAVSSFQQALQASPETGNIHLYLARVYQRMGDKPAAQREETAFRKWQRENIEADNRAKRLQGKRGAQSTHSSQKP